MAGAGAVASLAGSPAAALASPRKILSLGDSITHGWGDPAMNTDLAHAGYRRRFSKLLHGAGIDHTYTVRAIDGTTAQQWIQWLGYEVGQAQPDLLLLYLGVNDANPSTGALGQIEASYRRLLADAVAACPTVRIAWPWVQHVATSWDANTQAVRDAQFRIINDPNLSPAIKSAIVAMPDFGSLPTGLLYDGIHPSTPVGYDVFASQWFDPLSGYFGLPAS